MSAAESLQLTATPKVPIWGCVKAGFRDTFGNFDTFLTAAALPIVISVLAEAASSRETAGTVWTFLSLAVSFAVLAIFEIAWFRFLLLRNAALRPRLVNQPGRRFLPYFGYFLLLALPSLPALVFQQGATSNDDPASGLTFALVAGLYLLGIYLGARFGFVFLWIALDAPERLGASWRTTRKNGLRIVIAFVLVAVPFLLLLLGIGVLAAGFAPHIAAQLEAGPTGGWLFWTNLILGIAATYLFYAISCSVMVQAFCVLTGWNNNRQELLERFD